MREVLSISLPSKQKKEIQKRAKKSKMSISAFILNLIDLDNEFVADTEILKLGETAIKEHKKGKSKKINSLADLI